MARTPHIVVVDDELDVRDMIVEYLTMRGFKVSQAGDGKTLRHLMARSSEPVDLVLLDIRMPGEAEHKSGTYTATAEELEAIDEALAQADRGEVLTEEEAEAAFARFRRA